MKIDLPEKVEKIIGIIRDAGFEAFAVGGCVRDFLLGRKPNDWDITTDALPKDIKKLFRRTVDTGIVHGTVTVLLGKDSFEVTTYRVDGAYSDGRHPDKVEFTRSLEEDLKRRDFTINAFAYNPEKGLVDLFDGMSDLENHVIRAVGKPEERFDEDALRILRAFRFSAQLDFQVEEKTREAAKQLAGNLSVISAERIREELTKLLVSDHPEKIEELYDNKITDVILPELNRCMEEEQNNPHHLYTVGRHSIKATTCINGEMLKRYEDILPKTEGKEKDNLRILRYTMLFHDMGKPDCRTVDEDNVGHYHGHALISEEISRKILHRLKSDNRSIHMITALVRYHDYRPDITERSVRKAVNKIGEDIFPMLFPVRYADIMAQSSHKRQEKLKKEEEILSLYRDIIRKKHCLSLKDLAVDGGTLIKEAGMKPGKALGEMLGFLLEKVLEEPSWNEREKLLEIAREQLKQENMKSGTA